MSERIIKAKKILSGDNSGVVFSGQEKASYATDYDSDDFLDSDLITKKATLQLVEENAVPSDTVIESWSALKSTDTDVARKHEIDGVTYLFTSKVDDNISEPVLSSGGSWNKSGDTPGLIPNWSSLNTYAIGEFVRRSQNIDGTLFTFAYKSKTNGNIDNNPLDSGSAYWDFLGENKGAWVNGTTYDEGDVVTGEVGGVNSVFISTIDGNEEPLTDSVPSNSDWTLIGGGISETPGLRQVTDVDPITDYIGLADDIGNRTDLRPASISMEISTESSESGEGGTALSIYLVDKNQAVIEPSEVSGEAYLDIKAQVIIRQATQPEHAVRLDQLNNNDYSKHGYFSVNDTGQATITIPHGLGALPTFVNIFAADDLNTRNLLTSSTWTSDATNITITPQFLNNDDALLKFTWEVKR